MLGLSTLISTLIATALAMALGPLLARMAIYWLSGHGVSNLLVQARGLLLPVFGIPLLARGLHLPVVAAIGVVVGVSQAIAIARWGARPAGGMDPGLLGTLSLGSSGAAWTARKSLARGAIVACLGGTWIEVVGVEALLTCFRVSGLVPLGSVGAELVLGSMITVPFLVLAGTCAIFLTEMLTSFLFQRRPRRAATAPGE